MVGLIINKPMKTTLMARPESSVGSSGYNEFFRLLRTPGCRRKKNLSVSGVLKQDGGTQLTWQMKLQHGNFEVLAVLERDNTATPDADWARLQLRLAGDGLEAAREDDANTNSRANNGQARANSGCTDLC